MIVMALKDEAQIFPCGSAAGIFFIEHPPTSWRLDVHAAVTVCQDPSRSSNWDGSGRLR